ncbi:MAG: putative dehydrogenase [Planctomycetota bacterium]|nr:putative dehydrogenase [Planctomycetota bacterium]
MSPLRLNRRRFLGCSAAASLALAQGNVADARPRAQTVRLGFLGLGNRGTALLRTALELPGVEVVAVADIEEKHRVRAQGIAEKASRRRPDGLDVAARLIDRTDLDGIIVALPCDLHAQTYCDAIHAGKHLYAEKPLGLSVADCDRVVAHAERAASVVVHVGHQRRSNSRYLAGIDLIRTGDLGDPIEARANWISSNGPVRGHQGWLGRRERSGDWMVEQAVHVWDVLHWIAGSHPEAAFGSGRRGMFADVDPGRDVTDWYQVQLDWASGYHASMTHSWIDPADEAFTGVTLRHLGSQGGFDFGSGTATFRGKTRPREVLHPGNLADTRAALSAFIDAIASEKVPMPPLSLLEAREAVVTGLLVRKAVDEKRLVRRTEILHGSEPAGLA